MLPAISLDAISRELARRDLNEYQVYLNPDQPPARHSRLLNDKLMAVERGEITRLMVFMPPGHAKSHYATVNFPSWFLGRNPRQSIISCSYNDDLASAFGRRVRNIVASTEYQSVFNIGLAQDSRAVDNWAIEFAGKRPGQQAGEYRAAGVGGGITGRRGDVGVIDDPIKGREEADSATIRRKQWDWYINDFRTRLKPDNRIVIVMTRWHEDDLSGRILPEKYDGRSGWFTARDGERWYVLSLQAIAEDGIQCPLGRRPGEALWPEYYSLDFLLQQKATLSTKDTRAWTSLYQQRPAPESGGYFQRSWFKTYSTLPDKVLYVMTSDYAVTDGGGDKTEHAVWAIDQPNNIYAVDWWSGRTTMDVWIDVQLDLAAKWGIALAVGESGVIKKAAEPYLLRRMAERNLFFRMEWLASVSDKPARARGFQARASAGMVYLPDNKPWVADLLDEALTFPAGVYDDKVDCCGLLGRALDMTGFVRSAEKAKRQPIKKFTPAWLEYEPPKQKGRYL